MGGAKSEIFSSNKEAGQAQELVVKKAVETFQKTPITLQKSTSGLERKQKSSRAQ